MSLKLSSYTHKILQHDLIELTSQRKSDCRHKKHDTPQLCDEDVAGEHGSNHKCCGVLPPKVVDYISALSSPHRAHEDAGRRGKGCKHPGGVQEPAGQQHKK